MTLQEAAQQSGFSEWTLQKFIREKKFMACKPRGNRGGWEIIEASFNKWLSDRRAATSNRK